MRCQYISDIRIEAARGLLGDVPEESPGRCRLLEWVQRAGAGAGAGDGASRMEGNRVQRAESALTAQRLQLHR